MTGAEVATKVRANARGTCTIEGCERPHYAKGWCNPHYLRWRRTGVAAPEPVGEVDPVKRFLSRVQVDEASGCWLWTGGLTEGGYGRLSVGNKHVLAHRFAWETFVGPIPEGYEVDHVWANGCRHKHCVNYEQHLEPVTKAENVRRGEPGRRTHCPAGHRYDEVNTYRRRDRGTRQCRACGNGHGAVAS